MIWWCSAKARAGRTVHAQVVAPSEGEARARAWRQLEAADHDVRLGEINCRRVA